MKAVKLNRQPTFFRHEGIIRGLKLADFCPSYIGG